jgi:hypothetical protein
MYNLIYIISWLILGLLSYFLLKKLCDIKKDYFLLILCLIFGVSSFGAYLGNLFYYKILKKRYE